MIEQNTTDEFDEETAAEQLRTLEQAAVDGHAVEPSQLAEARERVTLAGLLARGRAQRAAADEAEARASAQAAAKVEAARLAADLQPTLEDVKRQLSTAIQAVLTAADDQNASLAQIRRVFDGAGLPAPDWGQANPMAVDGFDDRNYARVGQGDTLSHLVVDGQTYLTVPDSRQFLIEALSAAMFELGIGRTVTIAQY